VDGGGEIECPEVTAEESVAAVSSTAIIRRFVSKRRNSWCSPRVPLPSLTKGNPYTLQVRVSHCQRSLR
jgi:hypothetical protein